LDSYRRFSADTNCKHWEGNNSLQKQKIQTNPEKGDTHYFNPFFHNVLYSQNPEKGDSHLFLDFEILTDCDMGSYESECPLFSGRNASMKGYFFFFSMD